MSLPTPGAASVALVAGPLAKLRLGRWMVALAMLITFWPVLSTPDVVKAAPAPGGSYVGVWTGGPSTSEAAALDDLGTGWARVTVPWSTVEPGNGTFAWAALDPQMAAAAGGGRRNVLALVRDNPVWAAATRCTLTTDPERQQLAAFMGALANRYKGVVWQLYNEEDNTSPVAEALSGLGGCFGTVAGGVPNSTGRIAYAKAIEAASAAIHVADPTAQLAIGGVASGNFTEYGGGFDRQFLPGVLTQLKQDNSLSSLDYVAIHYYSSQFALYMNAGVDLIGRVTQLRQDMLAAGLTAAELKPIISDELSYTDTTSTSTSTSDPNNAFNLGQRAYVPKLLARAAAADVRAAFWFWLQDAGGTGLGADVPYGLKDLTGAPKPAYRAVRYFNSVISSASQFNRRLDLSNLSPKLEGYEFTTPDGHMLDLAWNQTDNTQISYVVPGPITSVTDPEGIAVAWSGTTISIGSEPRFITFALAPVQLLPQPVRVVDTRAGSIYLGAGQPLRGYTTPNCYTLGGLAGIPATAAGVVLNITTTGHPGNGYVTLYPAGASIPATSNLNFAPFEIAIANGATVKLGSGGQVCAVGMAGANLILDAVGYLSDLGAAGQLQLLSQPARIVDTRAGSTYPGANNPLSGYTTPNCYAVAGLNGIPSTAVGVLVNLTTAKHSGVGYLTVYPAGAAIPPTSNLNYVPAKYATANSATVKIGTGGQICAIGLQGTDLIIDAVGYLANVTSNTPVQLLTQPVRLVDTRAASGYLGAGQPIQGYTAPNCYTVGGLSGIPANAVGVILNITTLQHPGDGYLTVYPMGGSIPATSNLNFATFETAIANSATVKVGSSGQVCAIGMPGVQVVIDAVGYLAPGLGLQAPRPHR